MIRQLMKNKNGQNTAEYALLIALVVAGVIAMQTYAQRALQARVRDASTYMTTSTNTIGNTYSYEPVSTQSNYEVNRESESFVRAGKGTQAEDERTNRTRKTGGYQQQAYNTTETLGTGVAAKGL